jgi:hypothetical protein
VIFRCTAACVAEQRRSGRCWRRHAVDVHLVAARADASVFDRWIARPELFHWDDVIWRRRVPWLRRFESQARGARDLGTIEAALAQHTGIEPKNVERFWNDFIPSIRPFNEDEWSELDSRTRAAKMRFGLSLMLDFERITALLAIALAGRERFAQALDDALLLESEARRPAPALGAWLWGVFRFEIMAAQCRAFNVARSMLVLDWQPGTPAFAALGRFLADQYLEQPPLARLALTRAPDTGLWNVQVEPAEADEEVEALAA